MSSNQKTHHNVKVEQISPRTIFPNIQKKRLTNKRNISNLGIVSNLPKLFQFKLVAPTVTIFRKNNANIVFTVLQYNEVAIG